MSRKKPKIDARIQRTRQKLQEALLALSLESGFDAVSIRAITKKAKVGYATFFRHYADKEALLFSILETITGEAAQLMVPIDLDERSDEHNITNVFKFVATHERLFRVLMGSRGSSAIYVQLKMLITQQALRLIEGLPVSGMPSDWAANHIASSLLASLQWWIENDMPFTAEEMTETHMELVIRPMRAAIVNPPIDQEIDPESNTDTDADAENEADD